MIRVNPRQASLRAPEITSFQILTSLRVGRGRARAQSTPGQAKAAQRLPKDRPRTGVGSSPSCHRCREGKARGLLPKGTAFAPSHTSFARVPGSHQAPRHLPKCPARPQATPLCSLAPNSADPSSLARALLLPSCPAASVLFPRPLFPRGPQPLATLPTCGRSWLRPGRCCGAPELHQPRPHPRPHLREQLTQAGKGTAHTSNEIRAAIGARSC